MVKEKERHFADMEGFKKNMAYIHIHEIPHHQHKEVEIGGKQYKPSHKKESF